MPAKGIAFVVKVFTGTSKKGNPYTVLKCLNLDRGDTYSIFVPNDKVGLLSSIEEMAENELEVYYTGRGMQLVDIAL